MLKSGINNHWKYGPVKIAAIEIVNNKFFLKTNLSETTPKIGWNTNDIPAINEKITPACAPVTLATFSSHNVKNPYVIAQIKK